MTHRPPKHPEHPDPSAPPVRKRRPHHHSHHKRPDTDPPDAVLASFGMSGASDRIAALLFMLLVSVIGVYLLVEGLEVWWESGAHYYAVYGLICILAVAVYYIPPRGNLLSALILLFGSVMTLIWASNGIGSPDVLLLPRLFTPLLLSAASCFLYVAIRRHHYRRLLGVLGLVQACALISLLAICREDFSLRQLAVPHPKTLEMHKALLLDGQPLGPSGGQRIQRAAPSARHR